MDAFTCSAQVDSKGRVTIPSRVRRKLGLEAGDSIRVSVENAEIRRKQVSSFDEAKTFVEKFSEVESFSFDGEEVEVVLLG